jgi:hypothetical protein
LRKEVQRVKIICHQDKTGKKKVEKGYKKTRKKMGNAFKHQRTIIPFNAR